MKVSELHVLRKYVSQIADDVAVFIRDELHNVSDKDIEQKALNSLVSYVDKQAEEQLIERLSALIPGTGFITEEETVGQEVREINWIIDPLDGTTNYLQKIPHFSISIALDINGVVLGVVHDIMQGEIYSAVREGGAYINDRPIRVSQKSELAEAIIVTGFPYSKDYDIEALFSVLRYMLTHSRALRRLGSAALDLAYVASGKFDAYYEGKLNIWDLAAGALLVEEAGGKVTDYEKGSSYLQTGEIISSNALLYEKVAEPIFKYLSKKHSY